MALQIRDGTPHWWDSPDIWVVPGADPNGMPGQPIAGEVNFLWGRVRNSGDVPASGAQVNFYWSNPALGVLRSNSTQVGSAFVDLNPGEAKDVLCLVPWVPVVVNNGHECVVAEVIHSSDPLPLPLPDPFDPPSYRQVAQKNLSVLVMRRAMLVMPIQAAAPRRQERRLRVTFEAGGSLDKEVLAKAGLADFRPANMEPPRVRLSLEGGCGEEQVGDKELDITLKAGTARAVYLRIWPAEIPRQCYFPIRVASRDAARIDGGITFVLIGEEG